MAIYIIHDICLIRSCYCNSSGATIYCCFIRCIEWGYHSARVSANTDCQLCSVLLSKERDPAPPSLGHVQPQAVSHRELLHRLQPHVATATATAGQVGHPAAIYISNLYVNLRIADSNA